jgi:hypothetical protein
MNRIRMTAGALLQRVLDRRPTATGILLAALVGATAAPAAGPIYWDWPAERPFSELELDGAALDADGNLTAGLAATRSGPEGPEVFWRIVADGKGGYYTGTGHSGEIHHTSADGDNRLVARLEATEIFSLHREDDGALLAGGGPEGQLFRVGRKDDITLLGSVPGGYIWAMAADPDGDAVWLATGSPAAVYRYDPADAELKEMVVLPAQNALDLTFDGAGRLLVATQGPGLIYRLDRRQPDRPHLLYETAQEEARQFIRGPDGELFVLSLNTLDQDQSGGLGGPGGNGNAPVPPPAFLALLAENGGDKIPRAALYRVADDGRVIPYWTGDADLMIAAWSSRWGWLGGGPLPEDSNRSVLHGLTLPAGSRPVAGWDGGDILDILIQGAAGEKVVVGQAHPGSVAVLGVKGGQPRYAISPPLDGGQPVHWARLRSETTATTGKLKWSVRGGNRSVPDDSWSPWSASWTSAEQALDLDPCRFLQWRVEFPAGAKGTAAGVTGVSVSAWQENLPPVITHFALEYLQGLKLGMMGNHGESVTQTYRSGLQAEFSQGASADRFPGPERTVVGRAVRVFTWQGSDPNGDRLVYDLEYRPSGETAWRAIVKGTPETLGSWDTTEAPDGQYEVRLSVHDVMDNPGALAGHGSRLLGPLTVDNTPPEIQDFEVTAVATGFKVKFRGRDGGGPLAGARILLPDGKSERLDPVDRVCDSATEDFAAVVNWPRAGRAATAQPWRVRVEVRDLGGNITVAEGAVP